VKRVKALLGLEHPHRCRESAVRRAAPAGPGARSTALRGDDVETGHMIAAVPAADAQNNQSWSRQRRLDRQCAAVRRQVGPC